MTASSIAIHPLRARDAVLRIAIVGLALGTGYIHSTLGGPLFTLNALGYLVAALAMVVPIPMVSRFRWVVRVAIVGYAATTIAGWAIQGPFYATAYVAKAIEVALIICLVIDFIRFDGNPLIVIRRELRTGFTRFRRKIATLSLVILAIVLVAACSSTSGTPTPPPSVDPNALQISANSLAFSTAALTAPADKPFQIVFDNREGAPHNVAIYRDPAATDKVFGEDPFTGPGTRTYSVPALAAGSYLFRCDVHPDMKGTLTVE